MSEFIRYNQILRPFIRKKSRKSTRLEATLIIYINISNSMSICTSIGVGPQVLGGRQQCPVPSSEFHSVNSFKGPKWLFSFAALERGYDLLVDKEFPSTTVSAWIEPRGSILRSRFLGGVQFKFMLPGVLFKNMRFYWLLADKLIIFARILDIFASAYITDLPTWLKKSTGI